MSDSKPAAAAARPTLGMIGVGRTGSAMAARLFAAGDAVVVCDPVPAAAAAMQALGAGGMSRLIEQWAGVEVPPVPRPA